jgi:hypothetical protein
MSVDPCCSTCCSCRASEGGSKAETDDKETTGKEMRMNQFRIPGKQSTKIAAEPRAGPHRSEPALPLSRPESVGITEGQTRPLRPAAALGEARPLRGRRKHKHWYRKWRDALSATPALSPIGAYGLCDLRAIGRATAFFLLLTDAFHNRQENALALLTPG